MKLYKGLECPLDGYEIVLFSLSGPDGKTYGLCPFCYNKPRFESAHKVTLCPPPSLLAGCYLHHAQERSRGGDSRWQERQTHSLELFALV